MTSSSYANGPATASKKRKGFSAYHYRFFFLIDLMFQVMHAWNFENRVSKDNDSFYYSAIKSNKIRPKADYKPLSDAGQKVNGP